jgi:CRP-like cAMP-binding protein
VERGLRGSAIPLVAADPAPQCICMDFARDGRDSYALYAVRFWLTDLLHDDTTSSLVRLRIWAALKRASIPFARPTRTLFLNDQPSYEAEREQRHERERAEALSQVDLFKSLTETERADLQAHLVRVPYVTGERITRQGAIAHWLYILVEGRAEIQVAIDGSQPRHVSTLEAPDFFGEMGLMTGEPRLADVVAMTDVVCFRLEKSAFQGILQTRPELAEIFSQVLARRRVKLLAIRDGLDEEARRAKETSEASRILGRIQEFFGLD